MSETPAASFRLDAAPASPLALDAVETKLGIQLPPAYRSLLIQVGNGGRVRAARPLQYSVHVGLDGVYGVERDDWYDLEGVVERMVRSERVPVGFIPFGDAPGGNLVCFSVRQSDEGSVWFWDHELELSGDPMSPVADSMDAFFEGLAETPAPAEAPRVVSMKVKDPEWLRRMQAEQKREQGAN